MKFQLRFIEDDGKIYFSLESHRKNPFPTIGILISAVVDNDGGISNLDISKKLTYIQGYEKLEQCLEILKSLPYTTLQYLTVNALPTVKDPNDLFMQFKDFGHKDLESETSIGLKIDQHNVG